MDISINKNIENTLQNLVELYFERDYKSISKILHINTNLDEEKPVYKYNKNESGMIFYDNDNPTIYPRVYVDKETKYLLKTMLMVTSGLTDEKNIINLIINRWIKNVYLIGLLNRYEIPKIVGKESYIQVKVSKGCWNNMSNVCKNKGISIKVGFKIAVLYFIDNKIMLNGQPLQPLQPLQSLQPLLNNNSSKLDTQSLIHKPEKIEVLKDDKYTITDKINMNELIMFIENKVNKSYSSNNLNNSNISNDCWIWNISNTPNGYGVLSFNNTRGLAHRVSYIIKYGCISKDAIICHKCDKSSCINPEHLFAGNHSDNAKDAISKGRRQGECENLNFNKEQIKEIHNMFNNGFTKTEITKKFGYTKNQINLALIA